METIDGLKRLKAKFQTMANIDMTNSVKEVTKFVHRQTKMLVQVDTGELIDSIHMKIEKNKNDVSGIVFTNNDHAVFQEFGTGVTGNGTYPYKNELDFDLVYKDKGWIYTPDNGKSFYYTEGIEAQPYMYPSLQIGKKYAQMKFRKNLITDLKKISGVK